MAGGTFDKTVGKVRPGTYINFESSEQDVLGASERGIVLLPLINHSYGPAAKFLTISNSAPDEHFKELGYNVCDSNAQMLLIREALKNAKTVIAYIPAQGNKATATVASLGTLVATAKYGGTRGNSLKFDVVANPLSGFDVTIYLGATAVDTFEGLLKVSDLIAASTDWITFTATTPTTSLAATAATSLVGGTDGAATASDITTFLDSAEGQAWNTLAFPVSSSETAMLAALKSKIKYLRDDVGKYRKAVVADYACDYEGIINVANSYVLADGTSLTPAQATAWVAGADAGADNATSNTYKAVDGAVDIVGPMNHAAAVAAINAGKYFFSFSEQGAVVVEYDINCLITLTGKKAKSWRKNRVLRVLDSFGETCTINFPPNKYDNDGDGWDVMEGIGKSILKTFEDKGAITEVDYDSDFLVDRSASAGDQTYFNVGIKPLDSSEKLYFTITTR